MIISKRLLTLRGAASDAEVQIRLFAPARNGVCWSCRYEIDWPDGQRVVEAGGVDSMQAVVIALQMIAAELYSSDFHTSGRLAWTEPSQGYGFPIMPSLRDLLVGDDAKYL